MNILKMLSVVLAAAVLVACGSRGGPTEEEVGVEERGQQAEGGADSVALPGQGAFQGSPLDDPSSTLSKRVVYFEFDSSEVNAEGREIVEAHAAYLAKNPNSVVVLEGHADERGSREYNVALGERRVQSVRQMMLFQGVSEGQIQTVSYGEERPVALGHDEESWWKNRRVELAYER